MCSPVHYILYFFIYYMVNRVFTRYSLVFTL
nr:MAG TPA: hypothetical protein [Caudoviricetes sp.]